VPDGLFHPPHNADITSPLTDEAFAAAEAGLGIKLPAAYRAVLAVRNGGSVRLSTFKLSKKPPKGWSTSRDYYVNAIAGIHATGASAITQQTELARREWNLPQGLFPLCGDGHWWCCLDYRTCGPEGEPVITHIMPDDGVEFMVAASFEKLLKGLHRNIEQMERALVALDGEAPKGEALGKALESLGCTVHDYPGAWANPNFPLPPTWHWAKYPGLLDNSPVWITSERNKIYPTARQKTNERGANHPMLTVAVHPDHQTECLGQLLAALGPGAILIRGIT
jgi:hypothetical protein